MQITTFLVLAQTRATSQAMLHSPIQQAADPALTLPNRLFPLKRFPEEVISMVLVAEVNRLEFTNEEEERLDPLEGWNRRVELTTVSKRWKGIILGCPAFWTGFYLRPEYRGLSKMLPRWERYPRKVRIYLSYFSSQTPRLWQDIERLLIAAQLGELSLFIRHDVGLAMEKICTLLQHAKIYQFSTRCFFPPLAATMKRSPFRCRCSRHIRGPCDISNSRIAQSTGLPSLQSGVAMLGYAIFLRFISHHWNRHPLPAFSTAS